MVIKVEDSDPVVPVIFNVNTVYGSRGYGYLPAHLFKAWSKKGHVSSAVEAVKEIADKEVKKPKKAKKVVSDDIAPAWESDGDRPSVEDSPFESSGELGN